jgi:transcriptional regulator with XRE-family HTH domain
MVGKKIKKYLSENGIKQNFLSEKTDISISKISRICSGEVKNIDCVEYYKICKVLGVPFEYFLSEEV